ncbi:MAG: TonB-dependent receptor [Muribaculaceae bacterium]|nr:TonB-dependent receptor [Muribaculaceae bacterium]
MLKTGYTDTPPSADGWYDADKSDFHCGNLVAHTGLDYRFAPALSAEFTAAYTRYFSAMKHHCLSKETIAGNTTETITDTRIDNNINDWLFRGDFDWRASDNSHLRFGGGYTLHTFLPARSESRHITAATQIQVKDSTWAYTAHEANLYIEDDWRVSPTLHANLGLHMSLFAIDGHTHTGLGPRASISFNPRHDWALKAAYARTNQYVHQLAQTYLSLPTDQWVPVTTPFRPQTADKVSFGAYWQPANGAYAISVEAYYKSMRNLVDYRDEYYLLPPAAMWHAQLCAGKGTAKGIDITIGKQLGRLTGHISYSLAWADRTFPDKNNGRTFPARFDNRHTINIAANWKISDKVTLNAAWTGHSGNRFTLLPQMWQSPGFGAGYYADEIPLKTGINNYQLPFYHRLDLSCELRNRRGYFTLGLFNAYCHMNTVAIRRAYDRSGRRPVFQKVKLLPVIPSVSYTWQF